MTLNSIGLNQKKSKELAKKLNVLLSNYQIFYMNVRGLHWNIKGEQFFELHVKFEELYNDALLKVDEIAERILTLGQTPNHSYSEYLRASTIKETKNITSGRKAIEDILKGYQKLISLEREIMEFATKMDDEGTSSLMSDYIREQEKSIWMYSAYLN